MVWKLAECRLLDTAALANHAMDAKRSWTTKYEEEEEDQEPIYFTHNFNENNANDDKQDVQVIQPGMAITLDDDKEDAKSVPSGTRLV